MEAVKTDETNVVVKKQKRHRYLNKRNFGEKGSNLLCHVVLIGIVFLILYPFIEKIMTALLSYEDLADKTVKFIPKHFDGFNTVVRTISHMNYWKTLLNTLWVCLLIAVIQTLICTMIAYGFARFKFPGRGIIFGAVLGVLLIPPQVIMTPLFMSFQYFDIVKILTFGIFSGPSINLLDSIWPFVLLSVFGIGFKNSLYIYMMRQFFRGLPTEIEEAGMIDGCNHFGIFFRLMLPNAVPMMVTIFLFSFSWQWTDSYYTELFLREDDFSLLANKLLSLISIGTDDSYYTDAFRNAVVGTGIILTVLPLVIVYLFGQRFFVQGVSQSGIVG